jgi:hypothetical protein
MCLLIGLVPLAPAVDIATLDGRRYQEAEITWFYSDAVIVRYEGVKYARLQLSRLRPESLLALGFPPPPEPPVAEEDMLDGEAMPGAPRLLPQPAPRLVPLGSARPTPRSSAQMQRPEKAKPQAAEESEIAPRPAPKTRKRNSAMPRPRKQKDQEEVAPPANPFEQLLEDVLEENEAQRLQDRNLDGEAEKIDVRPFPGDNL